MSVSERDPAPSTSDGARMVCDVWGLVREAEERDTGILWRLAESGRQLDANLMHLAADDGVGTHAEPDLDVLLVVVSGTGTMRTDGEVLTMTPGATVWLPRGSERSIAAGAGGLAYLTVHQRRPGMRIAPRPDTLPPPPPDAAKRNTRRDK